MESVVERAVGRTPNVGRKFHPGFYPQFRRLEPRTHQRLQELLVRPSLDLDLDALNVFLRVGTFVGTDTAFRHIKADAPDYEWAGSIRRCDLNREQIIDAYIELFRSSVQRCEEAGTVCLPLSGGQDSRHILFELHTQGRKPSFCWTVDIPWRPSEAIVASRLCSLLNLPHRILTLRGNLIAVESRKLKATDFSSFQHSWMAEAVYDGIANDCVLYDGIGGDVLSAGLFLSEKRVGLLNTDRIDELVEDIVGPEEKVFGVDDPTIFPRCRAVEKVNEEFRRHLGAPDPISSFYFWNRTRRDIGCSTFALLQEKAKQVHTPYLDSDVVSFLAGLPPEITVDHLLHRDVIAKAYPEFDNVQYAPSGLKEGEHGRTYFRKVAAVTLRYLISRSCPMINRSRVYGRLFRSLLSAEHAQEGFFLAPRIVYLTELFRSVE
jgi:asparagine synthase (glutamine-hydrolysing)